MPLHAVCSTVRPAFHMYGGGMSYGGANAMSFPQYVVGSRSHFVCSPVNDSKMAGSKLETRQTLASARRSPDPHASQSVGRQDRDTTALPPCAVPLYRQTPHGRWLGRSRSVVPSAPCSRCATVVGHWGDHRAHGRVLSLARRLGYARRARCGPPPGGGRAQKDCRVDQDGVYEKVRRACVRPCGVA